MSIATHARQNGIYLGTFTVRDDILDFDTPFTCSDFVNIGDVIYFMYVGNRLMKIGKSASKKKFYERSNQYKRGRRGDDTNRLIMNVMDSIGETKIDVYAYKSPPEPIKLVCPVTGSIDIENIETAERQEKKLTKKYLAEHPDNTLPFCKQLK